MKRITFLLVVLLTMGSCISDPLPVANIPSVSLGENGKGYRDDNTGEEGELMRTSVRLYGFSEVNSSSILYERGFFVGNSVEDIQNGTASTYLVSSNDGAFSQDITGLDIDHTYYFCAFLKEGRKVAKSTINSFHTKAEGFALVNEITRKDDTVAARVSDNGGCEIKRVGFCYSLKESPDIFDNVILTELDEDGGFSAELSTLKPSETYYFRAFADNGVSGNRISYSEVLSITSEPSVIEVTQDSYLVDSEGGELVLSVTHNYPIEISIDVDWIHETATRAATLEDLRFQVLPSVETEERVGVISLSSQGSPEERIITITQKAGAFIIDFPDANFKAYCVESFDQNGDGEISNLEALEVQSIDVRTEHIETLRGIEHFTNLRYLKCSPLWKSGTISISEGYLLKDEDGNPVRGALKELDLSNNTKLIHLYCIGNDLRALNVSGLSELAELMCFGNNLSMLDVSGLTSLKRLNCSGNNLSMLDVSGLTELTYIDCGYNSLTSLDVRGLTELTDLDCFDNNLSALDISGLTELTNMRCGYNSLTSLGVRGLTTLTELSCYHNNLMSLDVSGLTSLKRLDCSDNNLSALDVNGFTKLTYLECSHNSLTSLDVRGMTKLTELGCGYNDLTALDVSSLTELTYLECSQNKLTALDVSGLTALTYLECNHNNFTVLDVSNNLQLSTLLCQSNPSLTEIWLKTGQQIRDFFYDTDTATLHYK